MSQNLTWVEISESAIKHNIKEFKKIKSSETKLMIVVKSNAYGHGMIGVSKIAQREKVDWLGVANLEEAIELRKNEIKTNVLVLSYYNLDNQDIEFAVLNKISLCLYSKDQAEFLNKIARKLNLKINVHIKIDTGTSRLGILAEDGFEFIKNIIDYKNLNIEGIFSHFASSEEDKKFTQKQLSTFKKLILRLSNEGIEIPIKHFACSATALVNKGSHLDMIRVGVATYGLWPSAQTKKISHKNFDKKIELKAALSLYTKIVQLKNIPKGSCVGYGCTKKVIKKTKLAVLPIGYFEGFDRLFSNNSEVIVGGVKCSILGRVCMNLIMVDVTKVKNVKVGDRVVVLGKSGREEISADDLAQKSKTINYEIVTRINSNIKRLYV